MASSRLGWFVTILVLVTPSMQATRRTRSSDAAVDSAADERHPFTYSDNFRPFYQPHRHSHMHKNQLEQVLALAHNFSYMLPARNRMKSLVHPGDPERQRVAFRKLLTGKPFKVVLLGGSITLGSGASKDHPGYAERVGRWLSDNFPNAIVHQGAVGGTPSSYMALCLKMHCPLDADMVILEYAVNDHPHAQPAFQNTEREGMERLVRKLMNYPQRPAVVFLNGYAWASTQPEKGIYWHNTEGEYLDFATYYGVPMLSVKAAVYQLMKAGAKGFKIDRMSGDPTLAEESRGDYFYSDNVHPSGPGGHRAMAELLVSYILNGLREIALQPVNKPEFLVLQEPLPEPMIPGNWESVNNTCMLGSLLQEATVAQTGFNWINEAKDPGRPKWGFVSTNPGDVIKFKVSTATPSDVQTVGVRLLFLKSYEHMGRAMVKCEQGCTCEPGILDGHNAVSKDSQLENFEIPVSKSPECIMSVTVLPDSSSGEHKVKVAGVVVVEGRMSVEGMANPMLLEYVHDISMRGNGSFDWRNHARLRV